MAKRYIFAFLFTVIPLVFFIFCFRAMNSPNHYFEIPNMQTIVGYFSAIGENDGLTASVNWFNESKEIVTAWEVYDIPSFFNAFGNLLKMIGSVILAFFNIIAVPFRVIGWLFGLFA